MFSLCSQIARLDGVPKERDGVSTPCWSSKAIKNLFLLPANVELGRQSKLMSEDQCYTEVHLGKVLVALSADEFTNRERQQCRCY